MRCASLLLSLVVFTGVALASTPARLLPRQAVASPTGRGACIRSGDSWTCELDGVAGAATVTVTQTITPSALPTADTGATTTDSSAAAGAGPSPVGQGECELHDDHWHCSEESVDAHAGHNHGPSAEYGCDLAPLEDYDLPLHIGAVFILLVASLVGVAVPFAGLKIKHILFAMKYFGGGIILSTAFVHLLFHAFIYFANECIGTIIYEPTSPAIAMAAVYVVFLLEFLVLRPYRRRALPPILANDDLSPGEESKRDTESPSSSQEEIQMAEERLAKYNVFALEAGVIFHSIIIGVTLGSSGGQGWVALLIAFTFHQLCEGIGLASRIALLPSRPLAKISMCVAFALTTSIGIVIGIAVRQSYNGNARSSLLAIGILDSLSAGILLYSALTQIIVQDFIANREMLNGPWSRCALAVAYFSAGMLVMSILGYWA